MKVAQAQNDPVASADFEPQLQQARFVPRCD